MIGSAAIDYGFEAYARSRLELAHLISPLPMSPDEIAWEMMKSRDFQNTKCEHGGPDDAPILSIPIPKLDLGYANHTLGIEYGDNPMHVGRQVERDPMNGKVYVTQSLAWFIKKGKPITLDEPITRSSHRKMSPSDPRRAFSTSIIESHAEEPFLPHHLGAGDAHILCEIEADLSTADETKLKERTAASGAWANITSSLIMRLKS
ncbi:MAG: hypothetical protein Q9210_002114 [Variospora velana]